RLSGRRTCRNCGHIWHVDFDPPSVEDVCDSCGGQLFQRDDDKPETIRHRLEVYYEQTAPLVSYYAEARLLTGIDAMGPVDDVTERALAALRPFGKGRNDPVQERAGDRAYARGRPGRRAHAREAQGCGRARDDHRR